MRLTMSDDHHLCEHALRRIQRDKEKVAMQFSRSGFSVASLGIVLVMLLVGCGSAATAPSGTTAPHASIAPSGASSPVASVANYPATIPADKQVTIVFYSYNLASAGIGKDATEQLITEFQQKFPNIHIDARGVPSSDINAKIQAEAAAGNTPDVVQEGFGDLDFVANGLKAKPLETIVPPDEYKAYIGGEYPLNPNGLKLGQIDGKTYGIPYTFSTPTLFYNADLFTAAGLDPTKPPTTWQETKQVAQAIKDKTGKQGVVVDCLGQFDWCFQGLVRSNGGRVLSEDRTRPMFAEQPAVDAVKMWQDLVQSGVHPQLNEADAVAAFQAGNLGMILTTSALQASLLSAAQGKFTVRDGKMPAFPGKAAVPTNSGSGLFILAGDPVKQRAAWEFMKFVTSERGYTIITSKIGYLPLRTGIVNDDRYLKQWAQDHPLIQPNLEQLQVLEPWIAWPGPNYQQEKEIMMKAVEQVVYNGANADTMLKQAQDRVVPLMPKK